MNYNELVSITGEENESLFTHVCTAVPKESLQLPSPSFVDEIYANSN